MRNIITYVREHNDSFTRRPLTEVDSLVLSQLSYLRYEAHVAVDSQPILLRTLAALPLSDPLYDNVRAADQNHALLQAVCASGRFGRTRVYRYAHAFDVEAEKQFAAVTFLLDDGSAYVAFRGTDATVIGWKEDMNMAFMDYVPSQQEGAAYLNRVATGMDGRLYIGGHSKGGNIAVYAASHCGDAIQSRLSAVFSHDGPGFQPVFFHKDGFKRVSGHIRKTLPQSSIIGMLLQSQEDYTVVKSTKISIMQHDPFSWIVEGNDFRRLESISRSASYIDTTLNRWASSQPPEKRALFINTIYEIIAATDARTIDDLTAGWWRKANAVLGALKGLDADTRAFILLTLTSLLKIGAQGLSDTLKGERQDGSI